MRERIFRYKKRRELIYDTLKIIKKITIRLQKKD